ncbi:MULTISPECIES: hypothetical protein [unclassified Brenneria]|uniref:hypothetical protein n=1 Tax=unclassified Brenneria TaxID=2634434 RepID=UPI0029C1FAA0|nr:MULTISPECIES: hypothetical protein [unclassified Brenneria]MDX5631114.1 hypothetical protein [Brenneria sp. L3-3Z]MDX5698187.1 hypothetical protein [Brenneria sp. L4-2C]
MNGVDLNLHNVPMLISRNKSKEWEDGVIRSSTSLLKFMIENQLLVNIDPFDENGKLKLDTVLKMSNVTEEGLEFYKKVVIGWQNYLAKSTAHDKYENISRLEKGLAKIRGK